MMEEAQEHLIEMETKSKPLSPSEKRNIYRRLYLDALNGNWNPTAFGQEILCRTKITKRDETALHVAVAANKVNFVEQLVKMMTYEDLDIRNDAGNTAFCLAAASGNVKLAKVMMKEDNDRNANLAMTRGRNNDLPLYMAASQGHREMSQYLYKLTKNLLKKEYNDMQEIFVTLIHAGIYDVALNMIKADEKLATARNRREETALHVLAQKSSLTAGVARPKHQKKWNRCAHFLSFCKISREESDMHEEQEAIDLVNSVWDEIVKKDDEEITKMIETPSRLLFVAAEKGNVEFLSILIRSYPDLIFKVDASRYTIFHTAVKHRQEEIFKLIHEFGSIKDLITPNKDDERNNMLHLAAKLPLTTTRLHVVPGAALQLQRELLWFEEVKKVVQVLPLLEATNKDELTPEALFIRSHEKLIKEGQEWMRGTADKCMLVATLIATVVFAAAFTVPGGNGQEDGIPVFLRNIAFKVFAVSDAVSFISSVASVLSFLGIMTSRYQLYDFSRSLPNKLIIGLTTLFISIVAMLVSFATTFFLVFNHDNGLIWFAIPIAVAAAVPVIVFIWMHSSLLRDMIKQTYISKSIFKPNKEPLSLEPQVAVVILCVLHVLGDVGTGKSSLVLRFVNGQFIEFRESTIGAAFVSQTLAVNDSTVKFEIWDTAGQERYHSLAPMSYRGTAAAIIVYDITNQNSFEQAKKWVQQLQAQGNPNMVMALAGNKADLLDARQVTAEEAQVYARENGLVFMETSAKTASNVNDIFYEIAKRLPRVQPAQNPSGMILMDRPAERTASTSCCT